MPPAFPFSTPPSVSTPHPSPFGLALVRAAGGDPSMIRALQAAAWSAYRDAGFPEGQDEDGMARWWSARIEAMRN